MTVTAHAYSAKIVGTSTVVPVEGGRITLDAGSWPHVSGTIEVPVPTDEDAAAFLAALDPRLNRRLEVTAQVTFDDGQPPVTRVFNLGIRSRPMRLTDASITLSLASDEALLEDYRALADDREPFVRQASLRSICNYVLNKAIPGAVLAAQPAIDRNVTAYWEMENQVTNTRGALDLNGWGAYANAASGTGTLALASWVTRPPGVPGSGAYTGISHLVQNPSTSWVDLWYQKNDLSVSPGRFYTSSAWMGFKAIDGAAATRNMRAIIIWRNQAGAEISRTVGATVAASHGAGAGAWSGLHRVHATGLAPSGATGATLVFSVIDGLAQSGRGVTLTAAMFTEGARLVDYFDGSFPTTGEYAYSWQGSADAATSLRVPINERDPDSLVWDAGRSAIDFLMTLVQSAGLRLVCDEQRVWTLRDENYTAPGQLDVRYAVNMLDADDDISRDNDTWFDAMVATWRWTAPDGTRKSRTDSYALPGATRVAFVERETAFPGKGFAQYAVRRAQGRGREVSGSIVADWGALAEQPVTIVLPSQATQIGITQRVEFDLDNDRITVSSRTRDTPAGAIDLLQGTIDGLTGSIDSL